MKAKFFNWYNALAATLLSLLGFSSCGENGPWGDEPVLYGTPSTAFEAKGNITAEDGTPVEGIKAIIASCRQSSYTGKMHYTHIDSTYTDKNGNYTIKSGSSRPISEEYTKILLEDVDGEKNGGTFANDTIEGKELTFKKIAEGSGAWDNGTYEVIGNKKLKKKK